ncbi:MAG TPA: glycosyltransferase family 4 protein [Acidimicrobiales bacterium]|nr:glycosyltransferase family 4 protein [Acidimicrobiales bacterium]
MSRILLLSPWCPPPDGVGFHSRSLVESWRAAGHEVLVITSGSPEPEDSSPRADNNGIHVLKILGMLPRGTAARALHSYRPDVVIVQFTIASQSTTLLSTLRVMNVAKRSGVPVVVAFHEPSRELNRLGPLTRWIYRLAARNTSTPVAYSPAGAAALMKAGIFASVADVPHGSTPFREVSLSDVAEVRDRFAITAPLVLSLGFAHPDKGTELLVSSIREVDRRLKGDVQFLIAGSARQRRGIFRLMGRTDQRFHQMLMERISELSDVSIDVRGFVPEEDVAALLYVASAVVLPYRRATQSGMANLALGAGAVIVASDIRELRGDLGPAARYFRSGSVADLSETLESVLKSPQDQLRSAAVARASERSFDVTAERLLDVGLVGREVS